MPCLVEEEIANEMFELALEPLDRLIQARAESYTAEGHAQAACSPFGSKAIRLMDPCAEAVADLAIALDNEIVALDVYNSAVDAMMMADLRFLICQSHCSWEIVDQI